MNFSMKDIALITTMSGAIIFMSFLFPALGLADDTDTANETDIPEFNVSSSEFDIVGDFPEQPGTPTSGTLEYDEEVGPSVEGRSLIWLDTPSDEGFSIALHNQTTTDTFDLVVADWETVDGTGDVVGEDRYEITNEGQTILHENMSWTIDFEVAELNDFNQPNMTAEVDFEVLDSEEEASGGGIFAPVGELVGMLAYLGDIIFWFVGFIFEISITIVLILVEVMVFAVSLMQWLLGSYFSIVTAAGSWASVVLMLPGIMLFLEFAKLAMLGIKLLPTT